MKVLVGNQSVELKDKDLLGVGGEARVYRWKGQAVKIFHAVDPGLGASEKAQAQALRKAKLEKIRNFPRGLPKTVVAPVELVTDGRGECLGFTMEAISGAEDVLRLGQRKWREGVVSNEAVTGLFRNLHAALEGVHKLGVVVGDLNDSNVLFQGEQPWLIDADSMQFGGYPCVVGHERFLDPRLYGVDLTGGCHFTAETDWYSFSVMLFASWLYVHPYGGVHKGYPTLLRRAEARQSVMRGDVLYPKGAVHFGVLPDELLDWFEKVFDKDHRARFPAGLLRLRWTDCSCGARHARPVCPACTAQRPVVLREAIRFQGRCRQVVLLRTSGRILAAAVQDNLKYLVEERGVVRREDGARVMEQEISPDMRFAIAGATTWVGLGSRLVPVLKESKGTSLTTGMLGRLPMFDASSSALYRLQDEWLMESVTGMRIGRVLEGQTWMRVGERLGFGFYRAGHVTMYFLFRHGRAGLQDVKLPPIDGRLIDAEAVFDEKHVLFLTSTEKDGVRHNSMFFLREDGTLLASASAAADTTRMLTSVHGKVVQNGRILCSTDQGLLSLRVDPASGEIHEGTLFTDTEPFVEAGAQLLPGPDGTVYVVTNQEIAQLSLA